MNRGGKKTNCCCCPEAAESYAGGIKPESHRRGETLSVLACLGEFLKENSGRLILGGTFSVVAVITAALLMSEHMSFVFHYFLLPRHSWKLCVSNHQLCESSLSGFVVFVCHPSGNVTCVLSCLSLWLEAEKKQKKQMQRFNNRITGYRNRKIKFLSAVQHMSSIRN